jgi:hypothetical protein
MLHQLAKGLGIGIDVLEQFVTGRLPALQPAFELAASASRVILSAAMLAANSGWPVAKTASCLISSSAISSRSSSAVRTSDGVMDGKVMYWEFQVSIALR